MESEELPIERNAVVFRLEPAPESTQNHKEEEDDNFYDITIRDVSLMQKDLTERMHQQLVLLPTKYIKEKDMELKRQAWTNTIVRYKLLGKYIIQAQFSSSESVSKLFTFVEDCFSTNNFEIRLIPEKLAPTDTRNLIEAGIAPKSLVILSFTDEIADENLDTFFHSCGSIRSCEREEADVISNQWLSSNSVYRPFLSSAANLLQQQESSNAALDKPEASEYKPSPSLQRQRENPNLPKWLKRK